jgi:type VI secretion system protein ImpF
VKVARDATVDRTELKIRFTVNADLFCDPVNVPVEFIAEVEMDSGKIQISRF